MDKLGPVREAVVQKDDDWEEWGLEELAENLGKYTDRNPLPLVESNPPASGDTVPENRDSHQIKGSLSQLMLFETDMFL